MSGLFRRVTGCSARDALVLWAQIGVLMAIWWGVSAVSVRIGWPANLVGIVLMLALFGGSLFAKQSLIERLARLQTPDLPPEGVRYTRRITQIWCVFFVLNGSMAAALVLMRQYDWWALYTGIVSYVLMGLLLGGEWVYRKAVLKL